MLVSLCGITATSFLNICYQTMNDFIWKIITATLDQYNLKRTLEFLLLSPGGDRDDNEYVLYCQDALWRCIGPVPVHVATEFVNIFHEMEMNSFSCQEAEFLNKGIPTDLEATGYLNANSRRFLPSNPFHSGRGFSAIPVSDPEEFGHA